MNSFLPALYISIVRLLACVWQHAENFLRESGLEEPTGQSGGLQRSLWLAYAMADGMAGHSLVLPPSVSRGEKNQVRQTTHSVAYGHGSSNLQQGVGHFPSSNSRCQIFAVLLHAIRCDRKSAQVSICGVEQCSKNLQFPSPTAEVPHAISSTSGMPVCIPTACRTQQCRLRCQMVRTQRQALIRKHHEPLGSFCARLATPRGDLHVQDAHSNQAEPRA